MLTNYLPSRASTPPSRRRPTNAVASLTIVAATAAATACAGGQPSSTAATETSVTGVVRAEDAQTQFVERGSVRYAYRFIGVPNGVPILLMTRFRGTMDDWDPLFLNELGKQRPVLIFNNAGVATSTGEVPTTIKGAADHAAQLCAALRLTTVDILGWSMAGFTAQVLAIEHPRLVRNVVLIGTGPGASKETPPPSRPDVFNVASQKPSSDTIWGEDGHEYLFFAPARRRRRQRYERRSRGSTIGSRRAWKAPPPPRSWNAKARRFRDSGSRGKATTSLVSRTCGSRR